MLTREFSKHWAVFLQCMDCAVHGLWCRMSVGRPWARCLACVCTCSKISSSSYTVMIRHQQPVVLAITAVRKHSCFKLSRTTQMMFTYTITGLQSCCYDATSGTWGTIAVCGRATRRRRLHAKGEQKVMLGLLAYFACVQWSTVQRITGKVMRVWCKRFGG